jgi:hypothetical protein
MTNINVATSTEFSSMPSGREALVIIGSVEEGSSSGCAVVVGVDVDVDVDVDAISVDEIELVMSQTEA